MPANPYLEILDRKIKLLEFKIYDLELDILCESLDLSQDEDIQDLLNNINIQIQEYLDEKSALESEKNSLMV